MATGYCTYTISQKNFYVTDELLFEGATWFDQRSAMILVPSTSWAKIKAYIIKSCKNRGCEKEVLGWEGKLEKIDELLAPKLPKMVQ